MSSTPPGLGCLSLSLVLSLVLPHKVVAADWYVDQSIGSDANSGTTPLDPWRTITHAIRTVMGAGNHIHVAAGVYDEALGEEFPWRPPPGTTLEGSGRESVLIASSSSEVVNLVTFGGAPIDLDLRSLSYRGPRTFLKVQCVNQSGRVVLEDITVSEGGAIALMLGNSIDTTTMTFDLQLHSCVVEADHTSGVLIQHEANQGEIALSLSAQNSLFRGNLAGIEIEGPILDLFPLGMTGVSLRVAHSDFVESYSHGALLDLSPWPAAIFAEFRNNIFSGNGNYGIHGRRVDSLVLNNNAFYDHGVGHFNAFITEGEINSLEGATANLVVDPGFVDGGAGDYHLRPDSNLVDQGELFIGVPLFDFEDDLRVQDGDGDSMALPDIGFDEVPGAPSEVALLRNDDVTDLSPITPPLGSLLPLDPIVDSYITPFVAGGTDPDLDVLGRTSRPLVFYGTDPERILGLVKTVDGRIRIFF